MKKLLIAFLIAGTAVSTMAQFVVFDVQIKGAGIHRTEGAEEAEEATEHFINKGNAKGWLIVPASYLEEGDSGWAVFIERGKGWYEIADSCSVDIQIFFNSISESKTKVVAKGVGSFNVEMTIEEIEMYFYATALGKYTYTGTEKGEKLSFSCKGSGINEDLYAEQDGYLSTFMVKVNSKLTDGSNEAEDAVAYLEEAFSKLVKTEVELGGILD